MSLVSRPACAVTTGGKVCGEDAKYKVSVHCTGCPPSHRDGHVYACETHLKHMVQRKVNCSTCMTPDKALEWEELPKPKTRQATATSSFFRIGDAQRNEVTEQLTEAFAGGFITGDEFDERSSAVQAAKTEYDLAKVTEDLRLPSKSLTPVSSALLPARSKLSFKAALIGYSLLVMTLVLITLISVAAFG